ncbi:YihY/virulence factor BrkB family protein [Allokutzneria oryzae]|uniref:YihY/virulence factor BrkB family protein n=1 Tax=Allokutzneria oryzae TaxID=1378989 RepID=A0ABV5ZQW0_9PSEU
MNAPVENQSADATGGPGQRRGLRRLLSLMMGKAWHDNIFSEAAEAAFWQTLSLPPLLLGLLGSIGYVAEWFGSEVVGAVQNRILAFAGKIFTPNVVDGIIGPTVQEMLTKGQGEVVSIGFLISLWAGSSATASFIDAITVAHEQYGVRNIVWQRILALLLYLVTLILLIIGLPVFALGPEWLPTLFPVTWQPTVELWVGRFYYPGTAVLLVLALTTLYKLALPRKLPWHRGLPGAVLAMVFFLISATVLRLYISSISSTGFTYGALATPIAFLLFAFFIGLAIVLGAHLNNAIQQLWPAKMTGRERRNWRRLEMDKAARKLRADAEREQWQVRAESETEASEAKLLTKKLPEVSSPADTHDTTPVHRDP